MRRAPARLERDPLEAFVRDGDVEAGRLGHHGRVRAPLRDERVGAEARVLLVHHRRHDEPPAREAAALGDPAHGADHRGHAALHVLRAAAVEPAVADLAARTGRGIPLTPTVSVCPQNISDRPGARPSSTPTTFGRPGTTSVTSHAETDRLELAGNPPRDGGLAARARARARD